MRGEWERNTEVTAAVYGSGGGGGGDGAGESGG